RRFKCAERAEFHAVNSKRSTHERLLLLRLQTSQIPECIEQIVSFTCAEGGPIYEWTLAVAAQVGPEDREVCGLVDFHSEIEKPRSITTVAMQQDHSRRTLRAFEQPTTSVPAVRIGPD